MSSKQAHQFDSEGFDLGAVSAENHASGDEIVYEVGGGITTTPGTPTKKAKDSHDNANNPNNNNTPPSPMDEPERLKGLGNDEFKLGNHLDACDYYTEAIEACPYGEGYGPSGQEMLTLRDEFDEANREKMMEHQRKEMEKRRAERNASSTSHNEDRKEDDGADNNKEEEEDAPLETFTPPRHIYGPKIAVYHANRAASLIHLGRYGETIDDCDMAILYNPTYVKAYLRRSTANERIENTEEALKDAQKAYELDPTNKATKRTVERLQKLENERLEKLKEETMGKLKDLGNSLLSNFGLSLDNFNAVQDPKSGGYSISFNQNK